MEEKKLNKTQEKYKDTCFVIMPISDQASYDEGHFQNVYEQIFVPAITEAGYKPYRVDENKISDSIIVKIIDAIQYAPMALCDLSSNNPNVMYELGLRQAYDKPVVLVKDDATKHIFDIGGINTVEYRKNRLYENVIKARDEIRKSIEDTKENKAKYSIISMLKTTEAAIKDENVPNDYITMVMIRKVLSEIEVLNQKINRIGRRRFVPNVDVEMDNNDESNSSAELLKAAAKQLIIESNKDMHLYKTQPQNIKKEE